MSHPPSSAQPRPPAAPAVAAAAAALRAGKLVVMPTETVYGLAANALDAAAVARIFEVKGRPRFNPLIVHVKDQKAAAALTTAWPDKARLLAEAFWPGPLTLVLPRRESVPDIVTAGLPTVAVRSPAHPVAQALLEASGLPLAAPSANRFTEISPTEVGHIDSNFRHQVAQVLDGGPCPIGVESTILGFFEGEVRLLRPGGLPLERIESVVGPLREKGSELPLAGHSPTAPLAPGMLARHYAPRTMSLWDPEHRYSPPAGCRSGLICFTPPPDAAFFSHVEVLSPTGDLGEAAARVFAALRRLDAIGLDVIVARAFPETGLGRAINDRLRRATHPPDADKTEGELE